MFACFYFRTPIERNLSEPLVSCLHCVLDTSKVSCLSGRQVFLTKQKNTLHIKKMQFEYRTVEDMRFHRTKETFAKKSHKKRTNGKLLELSVVAQLVFGFQDVKSCFLHLLALQLSVIRAKGKKFPSRTSSSSQFPKISGQVPSYHEIFITVFLTCPFIFNLKSGFLCFGATFKGRCFIFTTD